MNIANLEVYPLHSNTVLPSRATDGSSCYDISASLHPEDVVHGFNSRNIKFDMPVMVETEFTKLQIVIPSLCRVLIPTGFILNIPEGYSVRIFSRSGLSFKKGLLLTNSVGIIDSDYVEPVFVSLFNSSDVSVYIQDGERIAQMELVKELLYNVLPITEKPQLKTNRVDGFGSTG